MSDPNYYDFPTKGKSTVSAWMVSHWAAHDSMIGAAFAYLWRCGRKKGEALIKDAAKAIVALSTRIALAVEDGDPVSDDTLDELCRASFALESAISAIHDRAKADTADRLAKVLAPKPKGKGKR